MPETHPCPVCQTSLPVGAPAGFCPICAFRGALSPVSEDTPTALEPDRAATGSTDPSISAWKMLRFFGDYELIEEIGHGGMGVVFKARQVTLNRLVALKLISGGILASPALVKRFKLEAEVVAGLSHPNIVPLFETGEIDGHTSSAWA